MEEKAPDGEKMSMPGGRFDQEENISCQLRCVGFARI